MIEVHYFKGNGSLFINIDLIACVNRVNHPNGDFTGITLSGAPPASVLESVEEVLERIKTARRARLQVLS